MTCRGSWKIPKTVYPHTEMRISLCCICGTSIPLHPVSISDVYDSHCIMFCYDRIMFLRIILSFTLAIKWSTVIEIFECERKKNCKHRDLPAKKNVFEFYTIVLNWRSIVISFFFMILHTFMWRSTSSEIFGNFKILWCLAIRSESKKHNDYVLYYVNPKWLIFVNSIPWP